MQLEGSTPAGNALRPGFPGRPDSNREQPGWLDLPVLVLNHPSGLPESSASSPPSGGTVSSPGSPSLQSPGEIARGSARSVRRHSHHGAIASASLAGGLRRHPMAAGLGIQPEHIPEFRRELSQTVAQMTQKTPLKVQTGDRCLRSAAPLSLDLVKAIESSIAVWPGQSPRHPGGE